MIILNGKKFALNDKEFIDSLFNKGGTCIGYYKRLKRQVRLYNMQHELIGVINAYGVLAKATKQEVGYWYSYANPDIIGEYSITQQAEDINNIVKYRKMERCYFN